MEEYYPKYCVWETTLACSLLCRHCGSAAGAGRVAELTTEECLQLLEDLSDLGTEEITFSGGEFILRDDWRELLAKAKELDMQRLIVSNGFSITPEVARSMAELGVGSVSISLDGDRELHNWLRPVNGALASSLLPGLSDPDAPVDSYSQIMAAFRNLKDAGVTAAVITQVSAANIGDLSGIYSVLKDNGIGYWQIQLMNPMGRASCKGAPSVSPITPEQLPIVYSFIRDVKADGIVRCDCADNIGYFGSDEPLMRSQQQGRSQFWTGCSAGKYVIGITSNGGVRGCLSMPDDLLEGNIRETPLREIWAGENSFSYNRQFKRESLTGACQECEFGKLCQAGCHSFTISSLGRITENHHCIRLVGEPA